MIKLCTNCETQAEFEQSDKKFKCTNCGKTMMYPCASKDCHYMISSWLYCDKCWNSGLKKFGLAAAVIVAIPVAVVAAILGGKGDAAEPTSENVPENNDDII